MMHGFLSMEHPPFPRLINTLFIKCLDQVTYDPVKPRGGMKLSNLYGDSARVEA